MKTFLRPLRFLKYEVVRYSYATPPQNRAQCFTDSGTSKRKSPDLVGPRLTDPAPQPLTGSLEAHVNQPSAPYTDPSLETEYVLSCHRSRTSILSHLRGQKGTLEHLWVASAALPLKTPVVCGSIKATWHYLRLFFKVKWGRTGGNARLILMSEPTDAIVLSKFLALAERFCRVKLSFFPAFR